MIDRQIWNSDLCYKYEDELISVINNITNSKKDDNKWKDIITKHKKLWGDRIFRLRFKRDHKKQKRIQLAISYSNILRLNNIYTQLLFDSK